MVTTVFRFNSVDASGSVSFVGPAHGLKVLAAACSKGPQSTAELLDYARSYDPDWIEQIRLGLMVFDEHNVRALSPDYEPIVTAEDSPDHRAFRIIDAATRARSMQPAQLGLVIVNVAEQRIIQVQNSYAELNRKGRGRIRARGVPTRSLYHYELPEAWSIVP